MRKNVAILLVGAAAFATLVFTNADSSDPIPPQARPGDWRPISADLGIVLDRGASGALRGTLMTRVEGKWIPVALKGELDLAPPVIPLERR